MKTLALATITTLTLATTANAQPVPAAQAPAPAQTTNTTQTETPPATQIQPTPTPAPPTPTPTLQRQINANYPSARRNADLLEEIQNDPNRLIPSTQMFSFAVDGDTFWRMDSSEEFYHGIGYWLQARSEARVLNSFKLNVRSVFFAGSFSAGYAAPSGNYHLVAATFETKDAWLGGRVFVRAGDLDRQTVGAGTMIEDKEFNGGFVRYSSLEGDHSLTLRIDGTGVLLLNDDFYNLEAKLWNGYFGGGVGYWPFGVSQAFLPKIREPLYYIFTQHQYDRFSYAAEVSSRANALAFLARVGMKFQPFADFEIETKLEGRKYGDGFGENFVGNIQQQYTAYDQYDKAFTNAANIFPTDDDVTVAAAQIDARWKISQLWRLHSLNEVGRFDFATASDLPYYFFRHGVEYCPLPEREDCLNLFFSNKILLNSDATPPRNLALANEALFKMVPFFGIEGRFRF